MKKPRRFLWLKRFLLLACVLLLGLLVLEIVARTLLRPYADAQFASNQGKRDNLYKLHPKLGYEMIPNEEMGVNRHGMRGPDRTRRKPEGTFRVLVLGDSIAYGVGVDYEQTFSHVLEELLLARNPDRPIEVLNAGTIGYNTEQEYNYYLERGQGFGPDAVVIAYCTNDTFTTPFVFKDGHDFRLYRPGADKQLYNAFLVEHFALYRLFLFLRERMRLEETKGMKDKSLKSYTNQIMVDANGNLQALRDLARLLNEQSIPLVVVIFPNLKTPFHKYPANLEIIHQNAARIVTEEKGIAIDLLQEWKNQDYRNFLRENNPTDFVHPNTKGHRDAALLMAKAILATERFRSHGKPTR